MIVRLADPAPVAAWLDSFWKTAPTLREWLSDRTDTPARGGVNAWLRQLKAWVLRR